MPMPDFAVPNAAPTADAHASVSTSQLKVHVLAKANIRTAEDHLYNASGRVSTRSTMTRQSRGQRTAEATPAKPKKGA